MRIVTILIFLALAAGAYLVYSARQESKGGDSQLAAAQMQPASPGKPGSDASGDNGEPGGSSEDISARFVGDDLPDSFPSELKRRSTSPAGAAPASTMSNQVETAVLEPQGAPKLTPVEPHRPAREVSMPSRPEESGSPESTEPVRSPGAAITNITLPVKPAAVADAIVEEAASEAEVARETIEERASSSKEMAKDSEAGEAEVIEAQVLEPDVLSPDVLGPEVLEPEVPELEEVQADVMVPSVDEELPTITTGLTGSVVDSSGKVIPGVEIDVLDRATGEAIRTLEAGDDGQFSAMDLAAGEYALAVRKASVPLGISAPIGTEICRRGEVPVGYGAVCVTLPAAGEPTTAQIVLPLSSGIQGTVLGLSGKPEAKVLVRAISKVPGFGEHVIVVSTDAKGFFFLSLVPGPYELQMLLPGDGAPEDMARSMDVTAKPGSALLLEAVDFSKPDPAKKSVRAVPAAAPSRDDSVTAASVPLEPVIRKGVVIRREEGKLPEPPPVDAKPIVVAPIDVAPLEVETADAEIVVADPEEDAADAGSVELRGRIISKWGESLPAMSVLAETPDGTVVEMTQTNDSGSYVLMNVPFGEVTVYVARDLDLNRDVEGKVTLLKRPEPMEIRTFSGQKRVTLEDVVVDVRRVYRLAGKIKISDGAFQEFKKTIRPIKRGQDFLTDEQYRRAYYRGLRLVQNNRGGEVGGDRPTTVRGQSVPIAPDGTFVWSCTLPADDIVLVLEPRSRRKGGGYRGAIGIPVTPAGVRPASIEITYPAAPVHKKAGDDTDSPEPSGVSRDVNPPVEAAVLAAGAQTSPIH